MRGKRRWVGVTTVAATALTAACVGAALAEPTSDPGVTVLAAGDIASCDWSSDESTAAILDGYPDATVAALGDTAYPNGTTADFANCYEPTWGRHKNRTRPAVGDHEYGTPDAAGYFGYFGAAAGAAGDGWYSYDLGDWHVVVLNSNCTIVDCSVPSRQLTWLRNDLSTNHAECTVAYWHHPLFTSGFHAGDPELELVRTFWDALYADGADLILVGDDHDYERFGPQTPSGEADSAYGIRQFVVGTGGANLRGFGVPRANSEVRESATYGVLKLVLGAAGYTWEFLPEAGKMFTDTGAGSCHGAPDLTPPGPGPTLSSSHDGNWSSDRTVDVTWSGASDPGGSGVDGFWYSWTQAATDPTPPTKLVEENVSSATSPSLADGSWWFHLRTRDNAGNWSDAVHLGPFNIDATAPTNPTLSSSHAVDDWSNDNTVEATWAGASDAPSGLDGYSYSWTQQATSDPGTAKTVEETTSSATSGALADGSWWFHLRTSDNAGNWSATVHRGPFKIDTTAPTNPSLSSSSHTIGVWSNENTVAVEWHGAAGQSYSYTWTDTPTTIPDEDIEGSQPRVVDDRPDGSWWFHVRAQDSSGSWSGTSHVGPFLIDTAAPETYGASTAAGFEFSASEPATFGCSLDGGGYVGCVSPVRYDGLAAGEHVFRVFARDRAGNEDFTPAELRWTIQPQPQPVPQRPKVVKRCVVPRLGRLTLSRARTVLNRRGCRLGRVTYAYSRVRRGLVVSQRPRAGRRLKLRARVSVTLSRGALPRQP